METIMKTIDFTKDLKELYTAKKKPEIVTADRGTFFSVDAVGGPGGEAFQQAIGALYGAVYTAKFMIKKEARFDFKVSKLECLYMSDPEKVSMEEWQWRMLIRVPEAVTLIDLKAAQKACLERAEKKGERVEVSLVKRISFKEGRAVQAMHVGPYDQVGQTYGQLHEYAAAEGLQAKGPAHEIYISDPRRVAPERLKTIVRLAVRRR
jgi:hypothetical protein